MGVKHSQLGEPFGVGRVSDTVKVLATLGLFFTLDFGNQTLSTLGAQFTWDWLQSKGSTALPSAHSPLYPAPLWFAPTAPAREPAPQGEGLSARPRDTAQGLPPALHSGQGPSG